MMSAFACMFFQDPSIAEFQRQVQEGKNNNNLHTLFDVQTFPKDTQLRDVVDNVSSEALRPAFKIYFVFVAKPDDHQYMMQWLADYDELPALSVSDSRGRKHRYNY